MGVNLPLAHSYVLEMNFTNVLNGDCESMLMRRIVSGDFWVVMTMVIVVKHGWWYPHQRVALTYIIQ